MNANTAVATRPTTRPENVEPSVFEKAVMFGDISGLDERGRVDYIAELCKSLGLNPLGRAFAYINFGQGLTCYLTAMGASQLRLIHQVSILKVEDHGVVNGFYRMTVTGGMPNGRTDIEFGSLIANDKFGKPLVGQALENLRKKCLTQAKSRITKSLVGLAGMPAEDEKDDYGADWGKVVTAPGGHQVVEGTGEVLAIGAAPLAPSKPKPSPNDPAPESWLVELRKLAADLREATGDVHDIPADLTRGNARAMKEMLVTALAESLFPPIEPKPVASDVAELALAEGAGV